jgi:hypothetical protein
MLAISIAKLVAITFIILVTTASLKLTTITPLKRSAYKAIRGYAANNAS